MTTDHSHPLIRIETVALVAVGAFVGANARYAIGLFAPGPGGTFVANVLGCFLLGIISYEALNTGLLDEQTRTVLGTGFLSSFTTYSTFALETVQASPLIGLANVTGSYAAGFAAVLLGRRVAFAIEGER